MPRTLAAEYGNAAGPTDASLHRKPAGLKQSPPRLFAAWRRRSSPAWRRPRMVKRSRDRWLYFISGPDAALSPLHKTHWAQRDR